MCSQASCAEHEIRCAGTVCAHASKQPAQSATCNAAPRTEQHGHALMPFLGSLLCGATCAMRRAQRGPRTVQACVCTQATPRVLRFAPACSRASRGA